MPIDPIHPSPSPAPSGRSAPLEAPAPADQAAGAGFGAHARQVAPVAGQATQNEAAQASQALATGQATDPTAVVMAVERAQLAMQLASQIRTKAVEAAQDIFHTQV